MLNEIQKKLLAEVADLKGAPKGAYNIRSDGESAARNTTENINIVTKTDKPGIDIIIKAGTKGEDVHIPVIISRDGYQETVYNDFFIGEDADVTIIAGCGIHSTGCELTEHSGVHTFYVGKNAKVKYVEKHYGEGEGTGERVMNPSTVVVMEENSYMEMETAQIRGVDSTYRKTKATLGDKAVLKISEKIMTHGRQSATTDFEVDLNGKDCGCHVVSRSVAKDDSKQLFISCINGNNRCHGHTECDAIIMDNGNVAAVPKVNANNVEASLIHEAAIGKIAGEQLIKLMTLGLTEKEAEERIVNGFIS